MHGKRTPVFRGAIIEVDLETATLPNGATVEMELVRHPGGAAAAAVDADGRVCLLRQYRHAVGGWLWELPAGKLDPGEAPETAARRELHEEAGVLADEWASLGRTVSSPGVFTEVIHLYLARGLHLSAARPEPHEVLEVHWLPLDRALQWAGSGEISDAKTVIGLFRTRECLRSQGS